MIEKTRSLWLDGHFVEWEQGSVHLLTHTLHYGFGVFEGIRSYRQPSGEVALFRLDDHIERLFASARAASLEIPQSQATIRRACLDTVRENGLHDAYLRPLIFVSDPNIVLAHWLNRVRVAVVAFPWTGYTDRNREEGTRARFSSYVRPKALASFYKVKMCGHYALSVAALSEAVQTGYQQALFLDEEGKLCEATGENLFVAKNGVLSTPPASRSILMGITRDTVITIARDLGYTVEERDISQEECLAADEMFTTGTASELLSVRSLSGRPVGREGHWPLTQALQNAFSAAVRGQSNPYERWLTRV